MIVDFSAELTAWLRRQEQAYSYVVYEADPTPSAWTERCLGIADRVLLTDLAGGIRPLPPQAAVNGALARVGVGYACVWTTNLGGLRRLAGAGYIRAAHFGHLQCLEKPQPRYPP